MLLETYKKGNLRLKIYFDDCAEDPRAWSNFGTMICFHRRYNLGDKHNYSSVRDFLEDLALEIINSDPSPLIKLAKRIADDTYELEYNEEQQKWMILEHGDVIDGEEYKTKEEAIERLEEIKEELVEQYRTGEVAVSELDDSELWEIIAQGAVILPLYLYDHSGLRMSTSDAFYPFNDPWDSGQVGWIYVTYEKIKEEYGELTPETIKRAEKVLRDEVEVYDYYLAGMVYGYVLEKVEKCPCCGQEVIEEIDSCWGFYGPIKESGMYDELGRYAFLLEEGEKVACY